MSPRTISHPASDRADAALHRLFVQIGLQLRDARLARGWSVRRLARAAGMSLAVAYRAESGQPTSTDALVRLAGALGLRVEAQLIDPRRRDRPQRVMDPVHSAMGEFEARHLRRLGHPLGLDEPYQHYHFAGRADLVSWDLDRRALLHIENRTRFPDFGEMAGAFNAKRAYLAASLAKRLGLRRWASETHVMAGLWSSEVLHAIRLRPESFRSLCPDDVTALVAWWSGQPPAHGATTTLVVLDPLAAGRQRAFIALDEALAIARPRHRGYAEVVAKLAAQASSGWTATDQRSE